MKHSDERRGAVQGKLQEPIRMPWDKNMCFVVLRGRKKLCVYIVRIKNFKVQGEAAALAYNPKLWQKIIIFAY